MKKISLVLAMLLCLVPVLSACGANSSPEKAVKAALDVVYGDGDADVEDYWAVAYKYNLDIIDEYISNSDKKDTFETEVRSLRTSKQVKLNTLKDIDDQMEEAKIDDWDFSNEILY